MKKVYRAHPLMILSHIRPFLLILLLPFAKVGLQYLTDRKITGIFGLEMTIAAIVVGYAALKCLCFKLEAYEDKVIIRQGVMLTNIAEIPIKSLSSVQTVQNPLDTVFRAVTFSINTEAGKTNRSDFKFKLSVKNSREISNMLFGSENVTKVHFSAFKIAVMAAATSSAMTGMLVAVPVINRAGNLLGVALSQMLLDEINNVSSRLETYFPPIVNTITLILLLCYGVSFVYSFIKYINFRLYLSENKLEIKNGFFVRIRTAFKKSSIMNVKIEQTALMMLLKRYAMKVSVGGFGETKGESQVIVPSGRHGEIKNAFAKYFPFLEPDGRLLHAKRTFITKNRFLFWPEIYLLVVLGLSISLALIFEDFGQLIFFLTCIALGLVFYMAYIGLYEYKFGKVRLGNNILAQSTRGLRTCELYCPKENVGEIKITRYITDPLYKTCRLRITVCSESADSIRVRHLDYDTVLKQVYECFEISE